MEKTHFVYIAVIDLNEIHYIKVDVGLQIQCFQNVVLLIKFVMQMVVFIHDRV